MLNLKNIKNSTDIEYLKKSIRTIRTNAIYNLCVGAIVFVTSIVDIKDDLSVIKKEHFLVIMSIFMISNSLFKLYEVYTKMKSMVLEIEFAEKKSKI